jgi:hypothetical protein
MSLFLFLFVSFRLIFSFLFSLPDVLSLFFHPSPCLSFSLRFSLFLSAFCLYSLPASLSICLSFLQVFFCFSFIFLSFCLSECPCLPFLLPSLLSFSFLPVAFYRTACNHYHFLEVIMQIRRELL